MKENYPKAYKEVLEILNFLPQGDVKKIPKRMLEVFEEKKDINYNFIIDKTKPWQDQDILDETQAILLNIFRDYLATPAEKEKLIIKQNEDRRLLENEKIEKYGINVVFKNKLTQNHMEKINLPVEVEKYNFFGKIRNFIKKIFLKKI